jgi:TonB-dependent starch-binding outer membrane protein SusC
MKIPAIYCKGKIPFYVKKILFIMRLTTLFLIVNLLQVSAIGYTQSSRLNINLSNASIKKVLGEIENQSGYKFVYRDEDIENKIVSMNSQGNTIDEVLTLLLSNTGTKYKILENNLVIIVPIASIQQKITGTVTDASNGEPITGANILVEGTTTGTVTDINGKFSLDITKSNAVLIVSFLGYNTEKFTVTTQSVLDIKLTPEVTKLDEVVVVGYGTMKKSDISGSVVSVDKEQMMRRNPLNLAQGLQGAAAGVMVTKQSGDPEGATTIRIRGVATVNGSADPLYVVDGVQVGTDASFVNPSDVENIEVLKDASATAIYGAQGANGVILITTKKGQKGSTKINFTANYGIQNMTGKLKMADADMFAASVRQGRANDNTTITNKAFGTDYIGKLHNIDWQDAMTRMALQQNYSISASGGTDKSQSSFSLGYLKNEGVVIESDFSRLTGRANIVHKVKDFIEMGGSVSFEHTEKRGSGSLRDYAILTPTMDYVDDQGNFISHDYKDQTASGDYYAFQQVSGEGDIQKGQDNPYAVAKQADHTPSYSNTLLGSAYMDIKLFKGLSFRTILSYRYSATDSSGFNIANTRSLTASSVNKFWLEQSQKNNTGIESYFTYNWKNDIHNLTLMAGNSVTNSWGHWVTASASDFLSDDYRSIELTSDQTTRTGKGGYDLQSRYISYYGRATYNLLGRYIFTGTIRRDGSSNFGTGNRWGTFPSAALAWRASEEKFIQNLNVFSNLKLRLGWGITGNAGKATDLSVAQLSSNRIAYYMGTLGGTSATADNTLLTGVAQLQEIDTNLKWESNEQTNIGLDVSFFNNSLNITTDYFVRDSKDLLLNRTMRPSTGHSSVYTNAGHIRNSGFEFSVNYTKNLGNWTLGATATGSTLKNKVIDVGDPIYSSSNAKGSSDVDAGDQWASHSVTMNGSTVGSFYGYVVEGIWQNQDEITAANAAASQKTGGTVTSYQTFGGSPQPGDYKYKDVNGDGYITGADEGNLGNGFPSLNYGLTLNARYKNFDAMVYMYGVSGMKIYSYSAMKLSQLYKTSGGIQNTMVDYLNNAWSSTNPTGKYSRLTIKDENYNRQQSSAWVKDGDFMKVANIQIGYNFPKSLINKLLLDNARIYISVENLTTLTGYKYGDPEIGNSSVLETGFDAGRYPYPRTFTAGLQLQF